MSYQFTQKWYRDRLSGLGSTAYIGPDQPWTAANASKWLTERTRECAAGRWIAMGVNAPPRTYGVGSGGNGQPLPAADCYATGRIKEAARAGSQRVQEWCCPPYKAPSVPVRRDVTQAEAEQYSTNCVGRSLSLPSGQAVLLDLGWWLHKTASTPSAVCQDSGITDGDYRLLCCDPNYKSRLETVVKDGKTYIVGGLAAGGAVVRTADQIAQVTAAEAVQAAEDEAVLVTAQEPEYGFFQRYGLVLALGAGTIGIGVVAGLIKRKRLNTKSEG